MSCAVNATRARKNPVWQQKLAIYTRVQLSPLKKMTLSQMGTAANRIPLGRISRLTAGKTSPTALAVFAAMIEHIDRGIGRIIDRLKETGELDNTLILFTSDNGACYEWGPFGFDERSRLGVTHLHTGRGPEKDRWARHVSLCGQRVVVPEQRAAAHVQTLQPRRRKLQPIHRPLARRDGATRPLGSHPHAPV